MLISQSSKVTDSLNKHLQLGKQPCIGNMKLTVLGSQTSVFQDDVNKSVWEYPKHFSPPK